MNSNDLKIDSFTLTLNLNPFATAGHCLYLYLFKVEGNLRIRGATRYSLSTRQIRECFEHRLNHNGI